MGLGLININIGEAFKKVPGKVWMIVGIAILILAAGAAYSMIMYGGIFVHWHDPEPTENQELNQPYDPKAGVK